MWDEVGREPKVSPGGPWEQKLGPLAEVNWEIDSEFSSTDTSSSASERKSSKPREAVDPEVLAEAETLGVDSSPMATPNIHAMSNKEFEIYLQQLRESRPTFKKFLDVSTKVNDPNAPTPSSWERSIRPSDRSARRFLSSQQHLKYHSPESVALEQRPHYSGGLSYSRASVLQHFLLTKPSPGRIIDHKGGDRVGGFSISFAGSVGLLDKKFREGRKAIDWDELVATGHHKEGRSAEYHMFSARLSDAPIVVGAEKEGLKGAVLYVEVKGSSVDGDAKSSPNPHTPGSREYVAQVEGIEKVPSMIQHKRWNPKVDTKQVSSGAVLNTLANIVGPDGKNLGRKS